MPNLGQNFYPKLVQIASEVGMKPEDIIAIMASESGINSKIPNQAGASAIGLIQFTPNTLKGLGYDKDWREFGNVSAEEQLDYVKRYIQSQAKFAGKPLQSAAQFYVATYWPVALRLPGIQKNDPDTVFVEESPETVKIGNRRYSKKYYDIGIKVDPQMESRAYKENPLFHGSTPGKTTLGDMQAQVDRTKKGSTYKNAIVNMTKTTGRQVNDTGETNKSSPSYISSFINKLEKLLSLFASVPEQNNFLISVGSSSDHYATMEYARILSAALEEYLDAKTNIYSNENNIEIECKASGDKKNLFDAIKELSVGVADAFKYATLKIGSINFFALIIADRKSNYELLHPRKADLYCRAFKLKFTRTKK